MDKTIRKGIIEILNSHKELMRIPLRQKAKFEGWLKFEIAHYLEQKGMKNVKVEDKVDFRRDRTDITFFHNEIPYSLELKTPNTTFKIQGVNCAHKPIATNIQGIIDDAIKLNSIYGIVAFVLFPVPVGNSKWKSWLNRINAKTGLGLSKENNCEL